LEDAIAYINDDELLEVTPNILRLRKQLLNPHDRKKAERSKSAG
jgi:GTP-binding protein